eukprot:6194804-Pleurochrysis_carterae.AAC.1
MTLPCSNTLPASACGPRSTWDERVCPYPLALLASSGLKAATRIRGGEASGARARRRGAAGCGRAAPRGARTLTANTAAARPHAAPCLAVAVPCSPRNRSCSRSDFRS